LRTSVRRCSARIGTLADLLDRVRLLDAALMLRRELGVEGERLAHGAGDAMEGVGEGGGGLRRLGGERALLEVARGTQAKLGELRQDAAVPFRRVARLRHEQNGNIECRESQIFTRKISRSRLTATLVVPAIAIMWRPSTEEARSMIPEKAEKLGSIFLATFATGLAVVMAVDGMEPMQRLGAAFAVTASMSLAVAVRLWPKPAPVKARRD
jgi:hypothetical protein